MTAVIEPAARRLVVVSALRLHVARTIGLGAVSPDADAAALVALATRLRPGDDGLRETYGLAFEPEYPGWGEVETVTGGRRLVLTCRASYAGATAADVVTVLIPGRAPQVSAVPA